MQRPDVDLSAEVLVGLAEGGMQRQELSATRAVVAGVLVWVLASGAAAAPPIRVAGDRDYPPIAYLEDGVAKGFDVDVIRALGEVLGREMAIELMPWDAAQKRVQEGDAELLIGMSITEGYAPDPEQSTLALVAHHPQAIYFGTRQGRLLPNGSPDDLIRGSSRDPSLFQSSDGAVPDLDDSEPPDGAVQEEDEPAMA